MLRFRKASTVLLFVVALIIATLNVAAPAQAPAAAHSTITIHVGKTGALSGFGHNHVIVAPIAHGMVDSKAMKVEITVMTAQMKVADTESEKDVPEIQRTMLGPTVLNAAKFPEIHFKSSRVEQTAPGHFRVTGTLSLHGVNKQLTFAVTESQKRYQGKTKFLQTAFGIQPVKAGGGTVKVKDELELEFDIDPADLKASASRK